MFDEDAAPDEFLTHRYPLDGYDALGRLMNEVVSAGCRRLRAARRRHRELAMLRAAYALPSQQCRAHRDPGP